MVQVNVRIRSCQSLGCNRVIPNWLSLNRRVDCCNDICATGSSKQGGVLNVPLVPLPSARSTNQWRIMNNDILLKSVKSEVSRYESFAYFSKRAEDAKQMSEAFLKLADDILDLSKTSDAWGIAKDYLVEEARERAKQFARLADLFDKKANSIIESDHDVEYFTPSCPVCQRTSVLKVPSKGVTAWEKGSYIQDAFPNLTASQREMIKTGIHEECWDILFSERC